jgi:hypothetical protein
MIINVSKKYTESPAKITYLIILKKEQTTVSVEPTPQWDRKGIFWTKLNNFPIYCPILSAKGAIDSPLKYS